MACNLRKNKDVRNTIDDKTNLGENNTTLRKIDPWREHESLSLYAIAGGRCSLVTILIQFYYNIIILYRCFKFNTVRWKLTLLEQGYWKIVTYLALYSYVIQVRPTEYTFLPVILLSTEELFRSRIKIVLLLLWMFINKLICVSFAVDLVLLICT